MEIQAWLEQSGLQFYLPSFCELWDRQETAHPPALPPLYSEVTSTCWCSCQISSIPHSSHFLLHGTRAQVKGNMEFWDLAALSLVNLRESQSRLILLVGMEKAPYFKICCLHLTKMFRVFKKWMPKENWDELLEFVCTFHRGMKVLNAGTSTLTFFTVTPVTHFSNLNSLVLEVHLDTSPTS